jgi:hypothetical protein
VAAVAASPEARRRCFTSPGIFTRLRSHRPQVELVGGENLANEVASSRLFPHAGAVWPTGWWAREMLCRTMLC